MSLIGVRPVLDRLAPNHRLVLDGRITDQRPLPAGSAEDDRSLFARLLREHRLRLHLSCTRLAHLACVNPSYLIRIEQDEREPPRRHLVEAIARQLRLDDYQYRCFLTAAGYAPVAEWSATLEAVHARRSEVKDLERYDQTLQAIATHWAAPPPAAIGCDYAGDGPLRREDDYP